MKISIKNLILKKSVYFCNLKNDVQKDNTKALFMRYFKSKDNKNGEEFSNSRVSCKSKNH